MKINMPSEVNYIISTLEKNGYEAYAVGGCIRDAVMGKEPKDWDVCTPALPEQTMQYFSGHHIIETGLKHGTLTLVISGKPFEITTYRVDGEYSDNRRPDEVKFVNCLKDDLSRRDFTINAMAYNPALGLADFFDGMSDIQRRVIRCVGDADKRFQEDSLRIMRALRFASVLDFEIEAETSAAIDRNKKLLANIAVQRVAGEINMLVTGQNAEAVLRDFVPVMEEIIPEISAMVGFEQNNRFHNLDVWNHTIKSMSSAPPDTTLRLAMMLHDVAKPRCYTEVDSIGRFYGHPQTGSDMAKEILSRLKYDSDTIETVTQLILHHDADIKPQSKSVKKWLNRIGEKRFRQLMEVKRADATAKPEKPRQEKISELENILPVLDEVIEQGQCFSLSDLAVNGGDLINIGIPEGVEIGKALNKLLEMVIDESVKNDKEALLKAARAIKAL